jgi:hypothetical protein
MVPFIARETEDPFLQNGISSVPEGDSEADILVTIGNAGQSVLIPSIGAGASLVVRKRFPGGSVRAVVFSDGTPGPFAEIGPPAFPMFLPAGVFIEALLFRGERWWTGWI